MLQMMWKFRFSSIKRDAKERTIKSCGGGLCKCANERHRNDFIKYDAMMIRKQSPDTLRFLFGSLAG